MMKIRSTDLVARFAFDTLYTVSNIYNQMQIHKCDCCQKYRATHYVEYWDIDNQIAWTNLWSGDPLVGRPVQLPSAVSACLVSILLMLRNIKLQIRLIPKFFKALQILHGIRTQIRQGGQIKFTLLWQRQLHHVLECIASPIALSLQLFQLQFTWSFWQCWGRWCGNNNSILRSRSGRVSRPWKRPKLWFRWLIEKTNHAKKSNHNSPPNCIVRHGEYINNIS
jgi:hypothetical protein